MTQAEALKILKTGVNVFLTGEPGSGKTFVTNEYVRYLKAAKVEVAVTASTGIAATHLGGMTIHSWSGIGIKKNLTGYDIDRIAYNERIAKRVKRTKVLIIDEISMLDGDTLRSVDKVCQEIKRSIQPFGGLQVVFVGDFFQLPPVSRMGEVLPQFAFNSAVWHDVKPLVCYLSEQHRQEDEIFLNILSAIRHNQVLEKHCQELNRRCQVMTTEVEMKKITKLFSHNEDVDRINQIELDKINDKARNFVMTSAGRDLLVEQLKRGCLSPENLQLKKEAVVMFTKNSPTGSFVNGTLGIITGFEEDTGNPIVKARNGRTIMAEKMDWTIEDNGKILAKISQIPLRLAWAMTVHKSQGMSLDAAFMDLRSAFVEGQGYVAMSRVRNLSGLYLAGWNEMALKSHPEVLERDEDFRLLSSQARAVAEQLAPEETSLIHKNFIIDCGGEMPVPKSSKIVTDEKAKKYSDEKIREKSPSACKSWTKDEDQSLKACFRSGKDINSLCGIFGRPSESIRSRLIKLKLIQEK